MKYFFGLILLVLFSISACKKIDDRKNYVSCRIKTITSFPLESFTTTGTFSYTSWGAPESVVVSDEGTGNPSYYFLYDEHQRLAGFIKGFVNGTDTFFHSYHKYVYSGNTIVRDTIFVESSMESLYDWEYLTGTYEYDNKKRVVRYELHDPFEGETRVSEYVHGPEDYRRNNKSLMGTHPVLMFIHRDYSIRNDALAYNEFGYPIEFAAPGYAFADFFPVRYVTYDCSIDKHGHK